MWVTSRCIAGAQHQHSLIGYKKCALCHNLPKHQFLITSCSNELQVNMSSYAINSNEVTANTYSTMATICTEAGLAGFIMSSSLLERYLEHYLEFLFLYIRTFVHI